MLSREDIERFGELYLQMYGENISQEEAQEKATRLFGLVRLVYRPISKNKFKAPTN